MFEAADRVARRKASPLTIEAPPGKPPSSLEESPVAPRRRPGDELKQPCPEDVVGTGRRHGQPHGQQPIEVLGATGSFGRSPAAARHRQTLNLVRERVNP